MKFMLSGINCFCLAVLVFFVVGCSSSFQSSKYAYESESEIIDLSEDGFSDEHISLKLGDFAPGEDRFDNKIFVAELFFSSENEKDIIVFGQGGNSFKNRGYERTIEIGGFNDSIEFEYDYDDHEKEDTTYILSLFMCDLMPQEDKGILCVDEYGFDGALSPWEVIEKRIEDGKPIKPQYIFRVKTRFREGQNSPVFVY